MGQMVCGFESCWSLFKGHWCNGSTAALQAVSLGSSPKCVHLGDAGTRPASGKRADILGNSVEARNGESAPSSFTIAMRLPHDEVAQLGEQEA